MAEGSAGLWEQSGVSNSPQQSGVSNSPQQSGVSKWRPCLSGSEERSVPTCTRHDPRAPAPATAGPCSPVQSAAPRFISKKRIEIMRALTGKKGGETDDVSAQPQLVFASPRQAVRRQARGSSKQPQCSGGPAGSAAAQAELYSCAPPRPAAPRPGPDSHPGHADAVEHQVCVGGREVHQRLHVACREEGTGASGGGRQERATL